MEGFLFALLRVALGVYNTFPFLMVDKVEWRIIHIIVQMRTLLRAGLFLYLDISSTHSPARLSRETTTDNEYETAEVLSENLVF